MMKIKYTINEDIKINEYLEKFHLGKSKIYKLFLNKQLSVNGSICDNRCLLRKNDILELEINEEVDFKPLDYKLDIVYEDDYLLIINKPSKMIIYDDKNNPIGLANAVASYYINNGIELNVRYAHRLDTDTTGIIVFCKDPLTHSYFNFHMANHSIKREYRALAYGKFERKKGTLKYAISRDRHINGKMIAGYGNDMAITHYEVLGEKNNISLVGVVLETGKTHQIRCHFSYIGHPLIGDALYGSRIKAKRVMLHSYEISFIHPVTDKSMKLRCDIPVDMGEVYDNRKVCK